jgi:hypothetical protein
MEAQLIHELEILKVIGIARHIGDASVRTPGYSIVGGLRVGQIVPIT